MGEPGLIEVPDDEVELLEGDLLFDDPTDPNIIVWSEYTKGKVVAVLEKEIERLQGILLRSHVAPDSVLTLNTPKTIRYLKSLVILVKSGSPYELDANKEKLLPFFPK